MFCKTCDTIELEILEVDDSSIELDIDFDGDYIHIGDDNGNSEVVSPTASVLQTEDGAVITIQDKNGTTTAKVTHGRDGYTPQKNVDYFDGKDGIGIIKTEINTDGELVITYSDNTIVNLGTIIINNNEGNSNSFGITEIKINDNGELVVKYSDDTISVLGTVVGKDGINGVNGVDGKDGLTPFINADGNWQIGDIDTKIKAAGSDGKDGVNGKDGIDGLTPYINDNGNWQIGNVDTGVKAEGINGEKGDTGVGVSRIEIINNDLVITLSDETSLNLGNVKGDKGETGEQGEQGDKGDAGIGIDEVYILDGNLYVKKTTDAEAINLGSVKGDPATNIIQSVNGHTGIVKLTASDVGALSKDEGNQMKEQIQTINTTLQGLEDFLASI